MRILLLKDGSAHPGHTPFAQQAADWLRRQGNDVSLLDVGEKGAERAFRAAAAQDPDVILTLDLAGFAFRTVSGEAVLNMQTAKVLHLVWGAQPQQAAYLEKKISLAMLFYDVSPEASFPAQRYPNVLYAKAPGALHCPAGTAAETEADERVLEAIWDDFLSETMLRAEP